MWKRAFVDANHSTRDEHEVITEWMNTAFEEMAVAACPEPNEGKVQEFVAEARSQWARTVRVGPLTELDNLDLEQCWAPHADFDALGEDGQPCVDPLAVWISDVLPPVADPLGLTEALEPVGPLLLEHSELDDGFCATETVSPLLPEPKVCDPIVEKTQNRNSVSGRGVLAGLGAGFCLPKGGWAIHFFCFSSPPGMAGHRPGRN
jgi:hypothetical protein